jgi:6-phosphogluconolactonase
MILTLGSYTKRISQGIYTIELNTSEKILENLVLQHVIQDPTYLDITGKRLFSAMRDVEGGLRMYENDVFVNQINKEETPPCYVCAVPEEEIVLTANYHGGHVDVYSTSGQILSHLQRITYEEGSHAHCIAYAPRFKEVYVCDLGLDRVLTYTFVVDRLLLKHTFSTRLKQGPRHFVIHPTLPCLYVITELSSEVLVLKRYEDHLELIQTISTLPLGEEQIKSAAAIRISQDGRFLYVSNRGHDSITGFEVQSDARLALIQNIPTYGKHPRDFNLSLDGKYLVVANLNSDNLTLFERDPKNGLLTLLQKDIFAPEPTCVFFNVLE